MIQHIGVDACLNPEKFDVLFGAILMLLQMLYT